MSFNIYTFDYLVIQTGFTSLLNNVKPDFLEYTDDYYRESSYPAIVSILDSENGYTIKSKNYSKYTGNIQYLQDDHDIVINILDKENSDGIIVFKKIYVKPSEESLKMNLKDLSIIINKIGSNSSKKYCKNFNMNNLDKLKLYNQDVITILVAEFNTEKL